MKVAARNSGFSLVEVLVAILILGVALVGLTQGITVALRSGKESELQATAALLAAGRIETLRAEGGLQDGEKEGDCGQGLGLYRWKESIGGTGIPGLHEVAVVIETASSGKAIYELRTMLFEPLDAPTSSNSDTRRKSESRGRRSR